VDFYTDEKEILSKKQALAIPPTFISGGLSTLSIIGF